ncbi:sensor histidine kinase [Cupriavidus basilensis]
MEEEQTQVVAEPVLLVRAIANLVSNAIKFSLPQSTVTVRLYRVPKGLAIDVADQGRGIAEEDQGRLFQPFARLHDTSRDAPAGSGLGLVFVKTVVERHGGEISAGRAAGAGATFTIILPCCRRAPALSAACSRPVCCPAWLAAGTVAVAMARLSICRTLRAARCSLSSCSVTHSTVISANATMQSAT